MKIIVCTKPIRYTYARTGMSPDSNYIDPEDGIYRINPPDETATELALQLKDTHEKATVTLLTLGPIVAEGELRRCLAAGADDLCLINANGQSVSDPDPLDQPDPWVKSGLLARAVKELGGDLVLCGHTSLDRGSGQVGALLAHRLDLPFVSAINDLNQMDGAVGIHVQRSAGRGVREVIACRLPAVCSVDTGSDLRLPTFARRDWARAFACRQLTYDADLEKSKIVCTKRFQARPRPKIIPAPDSGLHAYERIMQLLTGSTVEKKGEMLTGSPESQVDGIIALLTANGFLESDSAD